MKSITVGTQIQFYPPDTGHRVIQPIPLGLAREARPAAGNDATGASRVRHAHSGGRFGRYDPRQHLLLLCPEPLLETVAGYWVR